MRRNLSVVGIVGFSLVAALAVPAAAEKHVVDGAGKNLSLACGDGDTVDVQGSGHVITLTGTCGKVVVNGTGQVVDIEAVAKIAVNGTSNRVTYQRGATKGKRPKIAKSGYRNTVSQRK